MPACFSMLLSVPIGIARTGCGTVTRPVFTGCLNCLWLPTCATSYRPPCFRRCMTSRLDIRHHTHFLHTCQVGVYKSATGAYVVLPDLKGRPGGVLASKRTVAA